MIKVQVSDVQRAALGLLTIHKVLAASHFNKKTLDALIDRGLVVEADANECSCEQVHVYDKLYSMAPEVLKGTVRYEVR